MHLYTRYRGRYGHVRTRDRLPTFRSVCHPVSVAPRKISGRLRFHWDKNLIKQGDNMAYTEKPEIGLINSGSNRSGRLGW